MYNILCFFSETIVVILVWLLLPDFIDKFSNRPIYYTWCFFKKLPKYIYMAFIGLFRFFVNCYLID